MRSKDELTKEKLSAARRLKRGAQWCKRTSRKAGDPGSEGKCNPLIMGKSMKFLIYIHL